MASPKQFHVAANLPQDFTAGEKAQARENIGAAAAGEGSIIEQYEASSAYGPIYTKINKMTLGNGGVISTDIDSDGRLYGIVPPVPTVPNKVLKSGTNTVEWGDGTTMRKLTTTIPPVETSFNMLTVFTDGRVLGDQSSLGCLVPEPSQGDTGKVLVANWSGSPGIGNARWETLEIPTVVDYLAGTGITSSENPQTGDITFSWEYSVGRNLHINQNNQIQTNLPGGLFTAPSEASNLFTVLQGADFAGAFKLACRHNTSGTYELGLSYIASGTSANITFLGTEIVIALDGSISVHPAFYLNDPTYNTPHRFGGNESTAFDPTLHKAIFYSGIGIIGTCCDMKMGIWNDNGTAKIAFTAIEVGRVGSTL